MSLECVPLSAYCQMTGETPEAINKRIQRSVWREGLQVLKIDGVKERWIDLAEVNTWARGNRRELSSEELCRLYLQQSNAPDLPHCKRKPNADC